MAADVLFFDSTDHYLGACQMTDKSEWQLTDDEIVTKFEIWYSWNQGETELPVKVYKDGQLFAEFIATRSDCDPYQHQWCNADFAINKNFPAGKYTTEITNKRQCLKPSGTGAVRLYKDDGKIINESVTISPTSIPTTISANRAVIENQPQQGINTSCNCNQKTIIFSAAVTSGIVSFLVWLILRKI